MKNTYNKGDFRAGEDGKISQELRKYGNKKWRRTAKTIIKDQLSETFTLKKAIKARHKIIWVKITKEFNGVKRSDVRGFYSEKEFKNVLKGPNIVRYFINKNKTKTNEYLH
ncbi:hypothetical protein EG346_01870 [Chryseobacterium carnipullorum]|uniref:Uncharacterized protein n=1 Tax=Chryseobacterium carnipullorum TaxID=1124835 RepID=A0A376EE30_CHRCU|nr:hypothetical protein [Chryseobacterium carnipullorum]AZA47025.1 hypothetical protein EG346_01870 [Chryseobacterium carnipullorum]AZA66375.1 hypothetical protein EG345_17975 [Chryseobacterium carnipullorum]STD07293.1 Uncharacterised protein [Chryseobacterium carnipullorum]